jgi:6-phosphogluconolactonase
MAASRLKDSISCRVFDDTSALSVALVERIIESSKRAIAEHGTFRLVLSGGSIVDILASTDLFTTNCDSSFCAFELWHVFLADERCVPISDEESTYGRMQRLFVNKNTNNASILMQKAQFDAPFTSGATAGDAAASYERVVGNEPMDLVILGVGADGHIASIFPKVSCKEMLHEERIITPVLDSPKAPRERITFSLKALKTLSRSVVVIACGVTKAPVIRSIFYDRCKDYPLTHIDCVEYFLDQLAASSLA